MILHRNTQPEIFFCSTTVSFTVQMVSQIKLLGGNEVLAMCYKYHSLYKQDFEKVFGSIFNHFNKILLLQNGEYGWDIIVLFKTAEHRDLFQSMIQDKEKSFDYNLRLLLESEVLLVGPIE